ncbi:hypothetical protein CBR_g39161 [Chara braunii]|uniref:C2 domain-containing protein n=1 Tax=Chara braunii TaxID=69332 RepID=A0A388LR39_CHABU|nr:hypothetical protein CBR_g39161 [Chara braunii]|eukprot:GBG84784.1 hypothetical protein CBR_g39161 [Chara braunii]
MMNQHERECSAIQLYLQGANLHNRDVFSKSDPMVVMEVCEMDSDILVWSEIERSEIIWDDLNPKWAKVFTLIYHFSHVQLLRFTIYDIDTPSTDGSYEVSKLRLEDQDFLGQTVCSLPELLHAAGQVVTKELKPFAENVSVYYSGCNSTGQGHHGSPGGAKLGLGHHEYLSSLSRTGTRKGAGPLGTLTIHYEEVTPQIHGKVKLQFCAEGVVPPQGRVGLSPFLRLCSSLASRNRLYLRVSRILEGDGTAPIFQTEVVEKDVSTVWKEITVSLQDLCGCDKQRPLRFECFSCNPFGQDVLIGSTDKSVNALEEALEHGKGIALSFPRSSSNNKRRKKAVTARVSGNTGMLFCMRYEFHSMSFLQYLSKGLEISFHVAVDFTASNGQPQRPCSLHYLDPQGKKNSYEQAISAVGRVLEFYDTDKVFQAWGFGARVASGMVSHCFNLNGNPYNPDVTGVEGILEAYSKALNSVSLAGPTLFAPVISTSSQIAEAQLREGRVKYSVLLIITDGIINDMEPTINAIVAASRLPLSILIVGVGAADFSKMVELDSDDGPLKCHDGRQAVRDIVQFVSMQKITNSHQLASELLAELPSQVVQFMSSGRLKVATAAACSDSS